MTANDVDIDSEYVNETEKSTGILYTTADSIQNCTTDESSDGSWTSHDVVKLGFYIMVALSVLINALLLLTVLSSRQLRRGASAGLVVGLTLSDMMGILCNIIALNFIWDHPMSDAADAVCKTGAFLDSMFSTTSVFLLVAVAYDRYVAVCRPLSLQKRVGSPLVQGITRAFICWFIATSFSIPQVWIHRMIEVNQTGVPNVLDANETTAYNYTITTVVPDADGDATTVHTTCILWNDEVEVSNSSDEVYGDRKCDRNPPEVLAWYVKIQTGLDFALIFVLPMAIIAALYCKTAHTLITSGTLERGNSADRLRRKRTHAARSLTALAVVNLLVLAPMNVLALLYDYELVAEEYLDYLAWGAFYTYAVSCTINAIVVCILSQKHRSHAMNLLRLVVCCRCRRSKRHRVNGSRTTFDYRMERLRTGTTRSTTDEYDSHSTSTLQTKYH